MAAPAATTATPPFASRQRGGEGLFALKSLASARPPGPGQQRSLREPKPVLSAGKSKIPCGRGVMRARLPNSAARSACPPRPSTSAADRALDPDLLQKPEFGEPNHRRLDGCGSHAM